MIFIHCTFQNTRVIQTEKPFKKAIHHLHGYIIETPTEKLTFGQATYVFGKCKTYIV